MIGRRNTPPATEAAKLKGFDDFDLRLGDVMRGERATLGKSLLDVQRELKIKATYIAAIENADPAAFETQGFIAGYVRSYARYLGLDPEWAYDRFCTEGDFVTAHGMSPEASASRAGPEPSAAKAPRDPFSDPDAVFIPHGTGFMTRIEPGAIGSVLVLLLLITVIGYGGYSVFRAVQKVQLAPIDQTTSGAAEVVGLNPTSLASVAADENPAGAGPKAVASAEALDRLYRPQALDVPVMVARDGPIATLDPADVGTLAAAQSDSELSFEPEVGGQLADAAATNGPSNSPGNSPAASPQVVAADVPEVVLFAVRPSWVRVQSADGTVIFEKILDVGEKYVLPKTEEPPVLRAGNAGSVYFAVNGQNYGPAGTGPSVVKNVALSASNLTRSYAQADISKDKDLARFVAVAEAEASSGSN
jgi:cytoskeletal protein RodZ